MIPGASFTEAAGELGSCDRVTADWESDWGRLQNRRGGLHEIRVSGGAVRSDLFNQIQADVYGRPVVPGKLEQATALGATILAAKAVGAYPDVHAAAEAMSTVDPSRTRQPDPKLHTICQEIGSLHDAVYRALADARVDELAAAVAKRLQELE